MRRAARVDKNQGDIVAALRAIGCTVLSLAKVGQGCPDILVGYRRKNYAVEIKDGSLSPSKRELTPDQLAFHTTWAGQIDVVNSVEEAIALLTEQPHKDRYL